MLYRSPIKHAWKSMSVFDGSPMRHVLSNQTCWSPIRHFISNEACRYSIRLKFDSNQACCILQSGMLVSDQTCWCTMSLRSGMSVSDEACQSLLGLQSIMLVPDESPIMGGWFTIGLQSDMLVSNGTPKGDWYNNMFVNSLKSNKYANFLQFHKL